MSNLNDKRVVENMIKEFKEQEAMEKIKKIANKSKYDRLKKVKNNE